MSGDHFLYCVVPENTQLPPPRRELEIPEGWGVKSPGKSRGEWVERINYFPEGQL